MIDANVLLPPWPFRRTPVTTTAELALNLKNAHITEAWVGSAEGCFMRDYDAINQALHEASQSVDAVRLIPWGTINPLAPDWTHDMQQCRHTYHMPGVRLVPTYHGYSLACDEMAALCGLALELKLCVQIVVEMEDRRTQNPIFRVPNLEMEPALRLVNRFPQLPFLFLSAFRQLPLSDARNLAQAGQVYFDITMLEGVDRLRELVEHVGPTRVMLGSGYPHFYIESALLKLRESELPASTLNLITGDNARQFCRSHPHH